jgi:hypothetical protein
MEEQLRENELHLILFLQLLFNIINVFLVAITIKNKPKNWDFVYWVFIYWVVFIEFEWFVFFA